MSEAPWGQAFTPPPREVAELAAVAVDAVRHRFGIELDLTSDTLPFLDHLITEHRQIPGGVRHLLASAAGTYLGETVRRTFGGLWHLDDSPGEPVGWMVRFFPCPLAVRPVALGLEIVARDPAEEPALIVAPRVFDALEGALAATVPVNENEYYSFCGRFDALHLVVDVLSELERLAARQENRPPRIYGDQDPANLI